MSYTTASNRISTSGYEYDKTGNLIRGQSPSGVWQRFEYDAAGRLVKIKDDSNNVLETYIYGASRERLIKQSNGQRTYYAWGGSSVLVEYTETATTPTWAKSYVYAGTRLLSTISNSNGTEATEYQHPNRLGTQLITNAVSQYEQSTLPFGISLDAETTGTNNQRFTSYDRSSSTGLDYAVNRTYNSGQSRFTQVDPIGMSSTSIGNPQSMNLFAYVQNNPIDFIDPSGLFMLAEQSEQPDFSALLSLLFGLFDRYLAQPVVDGGEVVGGVDLGGETPEVGETNAPSKKPDSKCEVTLYVSAARSSGSSKSSKGNKESPRGTTGIANHLYITTKDLVQTVGFRGGEDENGKIFANLGTYNSKYVDYEIDPISAGSRTLNDDCFNVNRILSRTINMINKAQINYSVRNNNSNAVAYTLLSKAGLNPDSFTESIEQAVGWYGFYWGWGIDLLK